MKLSNISITALRKYIKNRKKIYYWRKNGCQVPPPAAIKQLTVKHYAKLFSTDILVETGTYMGEMIDATKNCFQEIHSIEIDEALCLKAKERFKKLKHVFIYQGDSAKVLPAILGKINAPAFFWLDAHYSGGDTGKGELETPIIGELSLILQHTVKPVILIDDARCFIGKNDYPTLQELRKFVLSINPNLQFIVENDIIRIY